jgi:DNA gyrase inhibitor GyrI
MMSELLVRIVQLETMQVAAFHAFGATPELAAWQKVQAWSQPRGLTDEESTCRIFGFNNPNPSEGSPNYGYEFWVEIDDADDIEASDRSVEIKHFDGGLYAVAECVGAEQIGATWQQLVAWCEKSRYEIAHHQWLEEHMQRGDVLPEQLHLALYLPIADSA